MRTPKPVLPPNYDLIEISNVNQIEPKGCSFVVLPGTMYDIDATVRQIWGEERGVVYWITHTYKGRDSKCYYVPYPSKHG